MKSTELYKIPYLIIKTETIYEDGKEEKRLYLAKKPPKDPFKYVPEKNKELIFTSDSRGFIYSQLRVDNSFTETKKKNILDLILSSAPFSDSQIEEIVESISGPYNLDNETTKLYYLDARYIFEKLRSTIILMDWLAKIQFYDYQPNCDELYSILAHICVLFFCQEKETILGEHPLIKEWIQTMELTYHIFKWNPAEQKPNDYLLSPARIFDKTLYKYNKSDTNPLSPFYCIIEYLGAKQFYLGQESAFKELYPHGNRISLGMKPSYDYYYELTSPTSIDDYNNIALSYEEYIHKYQDKFLSTFNTVNLQRLISYVISKNVSHYINHVGHNYSLNTITNEDVNKEELTLCINYKHPICFLYYQIIQIDFKKYTIYKCDGEDCNNYILQNRNTSKNDPFIFCTNNKCGKRFNNKKQYIVQKLIMFNMMDTWIKNTQKGKRTRDGFREYVLKNNPKLIRYVKEKTFREFEVISKIRAWNHVKGDDKTSYDSFLEYVCIHEPSLVKRITKEIFYEYRIRNLFICWKSQTKNETQTYDNFISYLNSNENTTCNYINKILYKAYWDVDDKILKSLL